MIHFFENQNGQIYAVQTVSELPEQTVIKLNWLFSNAHKIEQKTLNGFFIGPRPTMVTPWSTNAVEITQNMSIEGILRIEEFYKTTEKDQNFDPMLLQKYDKLDQDIFTINIVVQPIIEIENIAEYNQKEGLALSSDEVDYLEKLSEKLGRKLTDSEVFGFSQINSEHCRHKIFNGIFIIDEQEKTDSLFKLIRKTSETNPNEIVSAYSDNVAFLQGPNIEQFAPKTADKPDFFQIKEFESVISLKAETHNFPTTVEPFNGAATGSGGEIRDRLAGGQGSIPLAGTSVYMTSYPRLEKNRKWEENINPRKWLYQTPLDILIKASNGASDFGNKFGQPLIVGSVLTFEHQENEQIIGFDKVIMLAGGIGYAKKSQAIKLKPQKTDKIVILGGDNYRIGMGGAAVSSADTGELGTEIELNAIQRSNPEMQKRVANTIRAMVEAEENLIVSIHDHGAGGHLNCLSELIEETGGKINLDKLPIGDPTLSDKEIIGNESQERMGLVIAEKNIEKLKNIAERERSPIYEVGEVTSDNRFCFESKTKKTKPIDLELSDMFGNSPKTVIKDKTIITNYSDLEYSQSEIQNYLKQVLQLEAIACKDWLTNKVDRSVGGKVAKQQCVGPLQLPLNNLGVMALDYQGKSGIATSIGHSPLTALISPEAGSRNSIVEALSNIIWTSLKGGLKSVSLSANWMWSCKTEGEDARLYQVVKACSDFAIELGINIPTGKDSLSMKQKYPNQEVVAPGTVIISAVGNCDDITKTVEPILKRNGGAIYYINLSKDDFKLGGSSFAQTLNKIGNQAPTICDASYFKKAFNVIQELIKSEKIQAGHDIGSGGLITTLFEMCFADNNLGANFNLSDLNEKDTVKLLFSENIGIVFQADFSVENTLKQNDIEFLKIGNVTNSDTFSLINHTQKLTFSVSELRDIWYKTSYLLDKKQTKNNKAEDRYQNYKKQELKYVFPTNFNGKKPILPNKQRPKAAVIREKGSNSERELANAMYLTGFDVKDVHMTDLISGRETLEEIQFIGAVGGFSNSDVLGSAKGWAGAFLYNEKAKTALSKFFKRNDTLSVGICNGCQLFMELELINPEHEIHGKMLHNDSKKHESGFTSVVVQKNNSVMLSSLEGATLGVWISHGEGKFKLPYAEEKYNIVAKYSYENYPANPNGSDFNTAMMCDNTGRHLVMMPHIERSIFPWNWAYYLENRKDEVSPWIEAFVKARKWIEGR